MKKNPMKRVHFNFGHQLSRRHVLRGASIALGLPALDAMIPAFATETEKPNARRFVSVSLSLGLHGPNLIPETAGKDYQPSRYLEPLQDLRDDFTVVSGSSHPGVSGGHTTEGSILTACPRRPGASVENTVSVDQLMAKFLGHKTRFPSLVLSTGGSTSPSYTENGAMIPPVVSAMDLFGQLFVDDTKEEQARQAQLLRRGQSIMDMVAGEARYLKSELGQGDRDKLDAWFTSIREAERRLEANEAWVNRPKPKPGAEPPADIDTDNAAAIEGAFLDVLFLALQTDSTRFATLHVPDGRVSAIEGVDRAYHT